MERRIGIVSSCFVHISAVKAVTNKQKRITFSPERNWVKCLTIRGGQEGREGFGRGEEGETSKCCCTKEEGEPLLCFPSLILPPPPQFVGGGRSVDRRRPDRLGFYGDPRIHFAAQGWWARPRYFRLMPGWFWGPRGVWGRLMP